MVTKYTISGWATCGFYQRAKTRGNQISGDGKVVVEFMEYPTRAEYKENLTMLRGLLAASEQPKAATHTSSPFVLKSEDEGDSVFVGGCDDFMAETSTLVERSSKTGGAFQCC